MPTSAMPLLRWQFDLAWSLFELHLDALTDADHRWEPATVCWTVRESGGGVWLADFAEAEPDPVPAVTIGWLTWHIGWWWSSTIDSYRRKSPPAPTELAWPGGAAATRARLTSLRADWIALLDGLSGEDLDAVAPFPWRDEPRQTVAHLVAWVNAELMKNVAEIGQLRLLRAAIAAG